MSRSSKIVMPSRLSCIFPWALHKPFGSSSCHGMCPDSPLWKLPYSKAKSRKLSSSHLYTLVQIIKHYHPHDLILFSQFSEIFIKAIIILFLNEYMRILIDFFPDSWKVQTSVFSMVHQENPMSYSFLHILS